MKVIFNLLMVIVSLLLSYCSNDNYDKVIPNDFKIIIKDEIDSYDTKTGTFSRNLGSKDTNVNVFMTKAELETIYNVFKEYDFLSFPINFECAKWSSSELPAFSTSIEITYRGKLKKVTNSTFCSRKIEQRKANRFDKISSIIWNIIRNKSQIKNIPESKIMFL